jgi:uncharacterized membrane protein YsdA (DUF1294 family)
MPVSRSKSQLQSAAEAEAQSAPPTPAGIRVTPARLLAVLALLAVVAGASFVRSLLGLSFAWAFLIAVNTVTLFLYGYDKLLARFRWLRIPEAVLHAVTLAGGTPAAFIGQNLFQHKTEKGRFRRAFWLIVLLQLAVFALWIYFTRKPAA